jgi:hypothetical protein
VVRLPSVLLVPEVPAAGLLRRLCLRLRQGPTPPHSSTLLTNSRTPSPWRSGRSAATTSSSCPGRRPRPRRSGAARPLRHGQQVDRAARHQHHVPRRAGRRAPAGTRARRTCHRRGTTTGTARTCRPPRAAPSLKPAEVRSKIVVCDVVERNDDVLAKGLVVKHANTLSVLSTYINTSTSSSVVLIVLHDLHLHSV